MSPAQPPGSDGIRVMHILPFDQARGAQRYARALVDRLSIEGANHSIVTLFAGGSGVLDADIRLDVPQTRLRGVGLDPRVIWRLRQSVADKQPNAVVAHGGESAKYATFSLPRKTPLIYLKIGSEHPKLRRLASSAVHRFYTRRADLIVTVSEALAEEVKDRERLDPERVEVIPNGRDSDVFRPAKGPRRPGPSRLLWVGQVDYTKRPERFVDIVARLEAMGVEVEASIVGDGPRSDEIRDLAAATGVQMLGTRNDVPALLADADLLVFTGVPPEGMPGVFVEAGLCGVPVVTTAVPGAADVVEHGVTGWIVDDDDMSAMVDAIAQLLADEKTRKAMGEHGRERCVERFTFEATASRWREVFDRLLAADGVA